MGGGSAIPNRGEYLNAAAPYRVALADALEEILHPLASHAKQLIYDVRRGAPYPWSYSDHTYFVRKDGTMFTKTDFDILCALVRDYNPRR